MLLVGKCHYNLSQIHFMFKIGMLWEHRSNLVMRESAFKANVSRQQCWINPRRALNAWEGDLARSPKRSDRRRDRRLKRVANSFHFPTRTRSDFRPPLVSSIKLHCSVIQGPLCRAKLEQKSLSLFLCQSVTLSSVCVCQREKASERQREWKERRGGGGTRKDARLSIQSLNLQHGVFYFIISRCVSTTCKHEPNIFATIFLTANITRKTSQIIK